MARQPKELRLTQLEEFLDKVKSCRGQFSARKKKELGKHFLEVVMGLEGKFVTCKANKESPDFEPRNESLYPWVLFVTNKEDLREEYDERVSPYLHPDKAGEAFHAVITNGKELGVFDFNHEVAKYTVELAALLDGKAKAIKHWQAFLSDFGIETAKENKKRVIDFPAKKGKPPAVRINPLQNSVICGDCIDWLEDIPPGSIDLCYIDPPFFSNKTYEIIWGNGYELRSFNDRWKGGIKAYIEWMEERVRLIHRCLKNTGSIFLHCDWRASHRLRVMLDEVFGEKNFVNEIVWLYQTGGASKRRFSRKHDIVFFYSKTVKYNFYSDRVKDKRTDKSLKRAQNPKGARISTTDTLKYANDFFEIQALNPMENERIGYRTQKPEKLLERIIQCSTKEGDVVLDCFGGGGTTAVVATKLNRKFITGDVSPVAVRVISDRLSKIDNVPEFDVVNVPRTELEWQTMDGHTFAEKICAFMGWECNPKKSSDGGVDGWANKGTIPVQIKNHQKSIGVNPIKNLYASLGRASEGIFVAWRFAKSAEEFRIQIKKDDKKTITFLTVAEVLGSILINDAERTMIDELYSKYDKAS